MRSLKKLIAPTFALAALAGLASNAVATNYPITWLNMAPTPFGSAVPNSSVFFMPGVGNVTVTYSLPAVMTQTRLQNAFITSGNVTSGSDNFSWTNFESFATIFTAGGNPLVPEVWRVTYTFPSTMPAGSIYLGTSGLGQTTSFGGGASIVSVNNNGTFLGDWSGAGGPWGPTQFTAGPPFQLKNSVNGAGGADPWWNTPLGVVRIDDSTNSVTVNVSQIRGDGIGVNIGFSPVQTGPCPVQCPPSQQIPICYEAGRVDNYAAPVDPTTPRPFFASLLGTYAISKPFDDTRVNAVCGTTFQNLPCGITSATLEIKLRAENDIPQNDSIYLQWLGSGFAWGSNISALPGAGGTWNAGQQQTFTINLGSLPGGIINQMNLTRALDVLVSDDTTVEYARLSISVCPCDGPSRIYTVGTFDNMAAPTEPTFRRPRLTALRTTPPFLWNDNDNCTPDRGWGTTFSNLPPGIVSADFGIRMRPCMGGAGNDSINFDLLNLGAPETFSRGFNISSISPPWTTNPLTNFFFNLGTTLPTTVCGTNLLGNFGDRTFDVYIQDDTGVDAARLRVKPCPPLRHIWGNPIQLTGSAVLAQGSTGIPVITELFGSGRDGVEFDAHGSEGQTITFTPGTFASLALGTELTIGLEGETQEDGHRTGLGSGKVSVSDFNFLRVAPGPNGTGTCTGIRIRNRATGESLSACLDDGQGIDVHGVELSSIGWGDSRGSGAGTGDGLHSLHFEFAGAVEMMLPDGRSISADSIEIEDQGQNPGAPVETCSFSWGISQTGYTGSFSSGIAGLTTTVNGVSHASVGPNGTLNANPSRLTVANIGSSGNDGVEVKWPRASTASLGVDITPVCGSDSSGGCDSTVHRVNIRVQGTFSDGVSRWATADMNGSPSSFFDIFCDFSSLNVDQVEATVLDENGTIVQEFLVPQGTPIRAFTNGGRFAHCDTSALRRNDKSSMQLALVCDTDASFNAPGRPPVTGRMLLLTSVQNPYSLRSFDSLTITGSGMSELDISGHTLGDETGTYCPADFNLDGGVDGTDVSDFFDAWSNGLPEADVNLDGGIDGSDVSDFFVAWSAGGC